MFGQKGLGVPVASSRIPHLLFLLLILLLSVSHTGGDGSSRVAGTDQPSSLEKGLMYLNAHPELLQVLTARLKLPVPIVTEGGAGGQGYDAICSGCKTAMTFVKRLIFFGVKWEDVRDQVVQICIIITAAEYESSDVLCPGIIDNYGPLVYDILDETRKTSRQICEHMNWCDPADRRLCVPKIKKRSAPTNSVGDANIADIVENILLSELQKKITEILNETGILSDIPKHLESGPDRRDKDGEKQDSVSQTMQGNVRGIGSTDDTAKREGEPGEKLEIPRIEEIVDKLDLGLEKLDIPGKISDFLDMARHPEAWKKKFPIDKILKESEKLEKKLHEVMANVKLKDDLEPNPRKMANIIADAITRATRGRVRRHVRRFSEGETLKVAHITDIHVEEDYLTGAATDCGLPTCCQPDTPGQGKAGHWGSYTCNIPPRTTRQILQSVASQKPEFVIYSGDNPPHAVWKETLETQLNASRWAAEEITQAFYPTKVFPNMGNHENFPTNMYYVPREETQTLNREFGEMFSKVAGFKRDQLDTIEKAGYYTILVKPGLRIVAYNSNYGGVGNFYNLLNYDRPEFTEMINWLENTLASARNASERVIITSHHQYGASETVVAFDEKITKIFAKYGDIIVWHPVGHVHRDEFRLNFDPETGDPVGVVLVAMTMNTLPHVNPGYRMYYLDPDTYTLLGYDQYYLDIEKANEHPDSPYPIVKLYATAEDYDMVDLTPSSYLDLYNRMMEDDDLLQQYWHFWRAATDYDGPCDSECKSSQKCHMISATYDIYRECMRNQTSITTGDPQVFNAGSAYAKIAEAVGKAFHQDKVPHAEISVAPQAYCNTLIVLCSMLLALLTIM